MKLIYEIDHITGNKYNIRWKPEDIVLAQIVSHAEGFEIGIDYQDLNEAIKETRKTAFECIYRVVNERMPGKFEPFLDRELTFSQLMIGLVTEGWLAETDGEQWLEGKLPVQVLQVVNTLPAQTRFAAKAKAIRPTIIVRSDPLVNALALSQGKTAEEIDEFFDKYSTV